MSHWILDWISHGPDMPLYRGGPRLGLGLWNSIAGTIIVEILMLAAGVWRYLRATRALDRTGRYALSPTLGYCWRCMWAIASADRRAVSPKLPGAGSSRELSSFPGQGGSTVTAP